MALKIETTRALRTLEQLEELVRAILLAGPDDESRSVEWKGNYPDIVDRDASFAIGRAILGLANRPVAVANASFEGVGYVLVGVEPGSLAGQQVPDSAELVNSLRRFTGHGWPLWDPRTIVVDGNNVLVITVEPPRDGDRIATLKKNYQPTRGALVAEGTIFVRQPGATDRATGVEIEMLQDRLLAGAIIEAEIARAGKRDSKMRTLIADMVHAANQWVDVMEVLVSATSSSEWRQSDWVEWFTTDSGRAMGSSAQAVKRNARKLRLLTSDRVLLAAVSDAESVMRGTSIWDAIHKEGSTLEERAIAFRLLRTVRNAFQIVESTGISILAAEPKREL